MKKIVFASGLVVSLILLMSASIVYRSFQPPQNYTGADGSNCSQCHGNLNNGGGSVSLTGFNDPDLVAGQQYNFEVALAHPSVRNRWGFALTARDANNQPVGSFTSSNPSAALNGIGEISHLNAVFFTGTSFSYSGLQWTAPANPTNAQRTVTFYFTGNAANGDGGTNGDFIYTGTRTFQILVPNKKPQVSITSPAPNSSIPAGNLLTLNANASDSDGVIRRVLFYANGVNFLEDSVAPYGLTTDEAPPGIYNLSAVAIDNSGDSAFSEAVQTTISGCSATGFLTAEGYVAIPGTQVTDLLNHPSYPANPAVVLQLPSLEYSNAGDNYGARLRGYICAPQTGLYTFYIAGDDQAGLWLSSNADPSNKTLIAYNEFPVGFRSFTSYPTQQSAPIRLVQGAKYYFETLHKQSSQSNHLTVAWRKPDGNTDLPIPGTYLSPVNTGNARSSSSDFGNALSEAAAWKVGVVPNPSATDFRLDIQSPDKEPIHLEVRDIAGRLLYTKTFSAGSSLIRLGGGWKTGVYFATVTQGKRKKTVQLIRK